MSVGRRRDEGPSGFLVVDKPAGFTSHDVVDRARRWLGTRRIGHLGTLDPLATGVLPLAVREATKLVPFVEGGRKRYETTVALGAETDTLDADGRVTSRHQGALPDEASVRDALSGFIGEIEQVPPMYSAVKQGGIPLHRLARKGAEVERAARRVTVYRIDLLHFEGASVDLAIECAAGTYVRVLAADLGRRLGCLAHVAALRRTASGPFTIDAAETVEALDAAADSAHVAERLVPATAVLGLPLLRLEPDEARRVLHGASLRAPAGAPMPDPGTRFSAVDASARLVAVLEVAPDRSLRPLRVLGSA